MFDLFRDVITELRGRASALAVGLSLAVVSVASGFISYTHISALTVALGGSWKTAHLMPLAVDGQIVIGSAYFMDGRNRWQKAGGLVLGIVPGIGESLFANWESGIGHGLLAAGWSTVPAQAFACSMIMFERWLKNRAKDRPAQARVPAVPLAEETIPQAPEPVAPAAQEAGPVPVHLHGAPQGAPWGLVSPAAAPPPAAPAFAVPTLGPVMTLAQRPKPARAPRPQAVPDVRLPLPADEDELRQLVASMSRNALHQTYDISKHQADKLRQQYLSENEKEVA